MAIMDEPKQPRAYIEYDPADRPRPRTDREFDRIKALTYSRLIAEALTNQIGSDNDAAILRAVLVAWITQIEAGILPENVFPTIARRAVPDPVVPPR
jgi:hypothetical protein